MFKKSSLNDHSIAAPESTFNQYIHQIDHANTISHLRAIAAEKGIFQKVLMYTSKITYRVQKPLLRNYV